MAVSKKNNKRQIAQEELDNEFFLEDDVVDDMGDDYGSASEDAFDEQEKSVVTSADLYSDLRSHEGNYVATNKKSHEAIVSVCFAKTGKRVTLSAKQTKILIDFAKGDWLDIKYSDATNTVLIGKSEEECGISPITNEKKYIIYDVLTVKDFRDTLCLDFSSCSSHSAYTYKIVELNGRPFIALTHSDFT